MATIDLEFDGTPPQEGTGSAGDKPKAGGFICSTRTSLKKGAGLRSEAKIRGLDAPPVLGDSNTTPNVVEVVLGAHGCRLIAAYVVAASLLGIELEDVRVELDVELQGSVDLEGGASPGYIELRGRVHLDAPRASKEELTSLHDRVTNSDAAVTTLHSGYEAVMARLDGLILNFRTVSDR